MVEHSPQILTSEGKAIQPLSVVDDDCQRFKEGNSCLSYSEETECTSSRMGGVLRGGENGGREGEEGGEGLHPLHHES